MSQHLNAKQIRALEKIGDILVPGDNNFPRFSAVGCVGEIDRIAGYAPPEDLKDLKMLLTVLSYLPSLILRPLIALIEIFHETATPVGPILRQIRMGLRGIVFSLYYADESILKRMEYSVAVPLGELKPSEEALPEAPIRRNSVHDLSV